jgi:tetratricopeptide (TPR) repeat protein
VLSETYFSLGQRERGLASAQRYVALSGEPNAQDTLGNVYQQMGRYEEARAAYLKALELKPNFEIAILHLGNVYFQLGRYREALEQYRRYIRIAPSDNERIRGHGSASWVYWRKGDFANAEGEAREASRLKQGDVREILLFDADLGRVHLTEQLREDILKPSILAGRGARENLRIPYFVAGYLALRSHNSAQALHDFRASLNEPPIYWNIDPLETCLADALLEMGRLDDAIAEYRRILSIDGNYPMALYRLSLALSRKGLTREANAATQRFLAMWRDADPDVPELVEAKKRGVTSQE